MKRIVKVFLIFVIVLCTLTAAVAGYIYYGMPNVNTAPDLKIERTAQRIERGKYLVNNVSGCMVCHGGRDYNYFAGPVDSSSFGAGGEHYKIATHELYSPNITPYTLHNWTDGEILRALTAGVSKNGKALFPLMPYKRYANMDKEDLYSIIAYLRTLKPISSQVPERKLDFPMNFIVNMMPDDVELKAIIDSTDPVAYGGYLVNAASCNECHSRMDKGAVIPGTEFAGGREFSMRKGGTAFSANITPDNETGIGTWSKEMFIQRFKAYQDSANRMLTVNPGELNTPMPWYTYSSMTTKDLGAIYDYLRTVKPVRNKKKAFIPGLPK